MVRADGFRVELDPVNGPRPVPHRHDLLPRGRSDDQPQTSSSGVTVAGAMTREW